MASNRDFAECLVMPRRNLNDLRSYASLLDRGVADVLGSVFPLRGDADTSLHLVSCRTVREPGSVAFHARFQIRALDARGDEHIVADDELPLGHVPELTEACTIVVDGVAHSPCARLVFPRRRLPGVVFRRVTDPPGLRAWFLPHVGHHLAIELDATGNATACLDNQGRVPLSVLLSALGCVQDEWRGLLVGAPVHSRTDAILEVARAVRPHVTTLAEAEHVMYSFVGDPKRNRLSPLGRMRIAYRLALDEPIDSQQLTVRDLLAATRELFRIARGQARVDPDEEPRADDRRRFRTIGALIEDQLRLALVRVGLDLGFRDLSDEAVPDLIPPRLVTDAADAAIARHFAPMFASVPHT